MSPSKTLHLQKHYLVLPPRENLVRWVCWFCKSAKRYLQNHFVFYRNTKPYPHCMTSCADTGKFFAQQHVARRGIARRCLRGVCDSKFVNRVYCVGASFFEGGDHLVFYKDEMLRTNNIIYCTDIQHIQCTNLAFLYKKMCACIAQFLKL